MAPPLPLAPAPAGPAPPGAPVLPMAPPFPVPPVPRAVTRCRPQSLLVPGSRRGRRGSAIGLGSVEEVGTPGTAPSVFHPPPRSPVNGDPQALLVPGKSPSRRRPGPLGSRRSSAIGIESIQEAPAGR